MSFASIIGQERAVRILRRAVYHGRVSHAYLLVGPPNVGKTLLAREFAKALNCESLARPTSEDATDPCDRCPACVRIESDIHPDVHLYQPLAKVQTETEEGATEAAWIEGSLITTEQIAHLVAEASLKATEARRKVFIITSAESMNAPAANRLLKTLEEPPGATTLVLTTQNLSGLLPTIVSRCQMVSLRAAPLGEAEAALAARYPHVQPGPLRSVVALSGGRIGAAVRLLERPQVLELRGALLDLAASLPGRDWYEGMALGERLLDLAEQWWLATEEEEFAQRALKASRDRVLRTRMNDLLDVLLTWFRDLALLSAGGDPALLINVDRAPELSAVASGRSPTKCRRACEDLEATRQQLRGNANLRLAAEVLAFRLISAAR